MADLCNGIAKLQSLDVTQKSIRNNLKTIVGSEIISFKSALGRVLSADIIAKINLPNNTNAAVDGYAFNSYDLQDNRNLTLTCCGTSWAGKPYSKPLISGKCVRIFTGAVLPDGADAVVMQEQIQRQGNNIFFSTKIKATSNIRYVGTDIKLGSSLLKSGKKITAIDQGLLATAGVYQLPVYRKLKIAFLSTGDELIGICQKLKHGQLYDSNRYTLSGLLVDNAFTVTDLGCYLDEKLELRKCLQDATENYDIIISTGGASVGDADLIKEIIDEIGQVNFWKIAMKPGKPLVFGQINKAYFFGLPGNPVSVIVTFQQIVAPALQQLSGQNICKPLRIRAKCSSSLNKIAGREEFQRGLLSQLENGNFLVKSSGQQGSHIMGSASRANCYIILPANCSGVAVNEWVVVEPFDLLI